MDLKQQGLCWRQPVEGNMKTRKPRFKRASKEKKTTVRTPRNRRLSATAKKKILEPTTSGVTNAIAKMRTRRISLRKAAREAKVSPRTVVKRAASALRKTESGRYVAKTSDRLVRTLIIPTPQGSEEINVRGLRSASLLGRYWVAVHKYYETGDA